MDPIDLRSVSNRTIFGGLFDSISGRSIYLFDCHNITIHSCQFVNVGTAILAVECSGIRVVSNWYRDIVGPSGNFVQFDKCDDSSVTANRGWCDPATSDPEDIISVYKSTNVDVTHNRLKGGGPSASGTGINLGDGGGSTCLAQYNRLVDTGQAGIGITGGTGMQVLDNDVFGTQRDGSNVGVFAHNYTAETSSGHEVRGNRVHWTNEAGATNHRWDGGTVGTITGWDDNTWGAPIGTVIFND